jgi:hypothetical protein
MRESIQSPNLFNLLKRHRIEDFRIVVVIQYINCLWGKDTSFGQHFIIFLAHNKQVAQIC